MKRMLVLGGSGFVGRHLVDLLAAADVVQTASAARGPQRVPPGVEAVALDATDPEALTAALKGVDGVINCVSGGARDIVANARALLQAARRQSAPPRIVHLSSMAVYGDAVGTVDENAALRDDLDAYASAKIEAERILGEYPRCVMLRPGCIYGPGGTRWSLGIARLLAARRLGDLGIAGEGVCNLVYVGDVAEAALKSLRAASADGLRLNLVAPGARDWNHYFVRYAEALDLPQPRRIERATLWMESFLMAPVLQASAMLARRFNLSLKTTPTTITPSMLRLWRQPIRLDARKATEVLRLRWTSLERGLAETASWVAPQMPYRGAHAD